MAPKGPNRFTQAGFSPGAGGPLSPYELLCLNSFVKCGHAFDLYAFDTNLAVPAGVQLRDARELLESVLEIATSPCPNIPAASQTASCSSTKTSIE